MHNPSLHSLLSGGLASHPRDSSIQICCVRKGGLEVCFVSPPPTKIKVPKWRVFVGMVFFNSRPPKRSQSYRRAAPNTGVSGDMPTSSGRAPCPEVTSFSEAATMRLPRVAPTWLRGQASVGEGSCRVMLPFHPFDIVPPPASRCLDHREHSLLLGSTFSDSAQLHHVLHAFPCLTRLLNISLPFSIVLHILS